MPAGTPATKSSTGRAKSGFTGPTSPAPAAMDLPGCYGPCCDIGLTRSDLACGIRHGVSADAAAERPALEKIYLIGTKPGIDCSRTVRGLRDRLGGGSVAIFGPRANLFMNA